jgi:chorismate lyase/3-hydroxybenzoate synthase
LIAPDTPAPRADLQPAYEFADDPRTLLGPQVLAVFGFGHGAPRTIDDPRYLHIGLEPATAPAPFEVWRTPRTATPWRDGQLHGANDGAISFGCLQIAEDGRGIAGAAEDGYRLLVQHLLRSEHPHLLRVWNYLDAITEGEGDAERYRQFCVGRVAGLRDYSEQFPAATAIGRRDGRRVLQVYWIAARQPGIAIENPRQVAAYRYPRQYGPQPPSFARAMLAPASLRLPLMLSGTAAVVGHASQHHDDLPAQLQESFRNFDALIGQAQASAPGLPRHFGADTLLKAYVREREALPEAQARLDALLAPGVARLVLHAEVCRRELLCEIDGFHGAP